MTDALLKPSRKPRPGARLDFEAEAMGELRTKTFRQHDETCRANATAEQVRRHSLASAR